MSTDECSSNESGWTTYIVSPYRRHEYRDDYDDEDEKEQRKDKYVQKERKNVDSDDSMASDASSGPREDYRERHFAKHKESKKKQNFHEDKKQRNDEKMKKAKDKADNSGAGRSKKR